MAAIRSLKNGKAPVQDSLCSELFKADCSLQHRFFSHSSQPYGRITATRRRHREDPEERSPELLQQPERRLPIVSAKQDPGKDHNPVSKWVFEREGMH